MSAHDADAEAGDATYAARLASAATTVVGRFTSASNATLLVALHRADGSVPAVPDGAAVGELSPDEFAVYKPELGEAPLWDFPDGGLWRRELAAFLVDRALGLGLVPTTIRRDDLEHGRGVLQRVVPHDPEEHWFVLREDASLHQQLRRVVVFDLLIDNADRKAGHVLLERIDGQRHVRAIDHGVCFHAEPHLRTVAWDFADRPLSDEERGLGARLADLLAPGATLTETLGALLSVDELQRLRERSRTVAALREFPRPLHERQVPWPLI